MSEANWVHDALLRMVLRLDKLEEQVAALENHLRRIEGEVNALQVDVDAVVRR